MRQLWDILKFLARILSNPDGTWLVVAERDADRRVVDDMLRDYYFPLLGGGAALLFLAKGFAVDPFSWEAAIKGGATFLISYFAGYYLAVFLVRELCKAICETQPDRHRVQGFVAYAMSFVLAVEVVAGCLPSMKFLLIGCLYIIYIVWCGARRYLSIREDLRLRFSVFASIAIVVSPYVVGYALKWMER